MKSYRDKAEDMLTDWTRTIMAGCGKIAEANCKELCPVDTGRLRNSITYDVSEDGQSVIVVKLYTTCIFYIRSDNHRLPIF